MTAGWDKKIKCWDSRSTKTLTAVNTVNTGVKSISLSGHFSLSSAFRDLISSSCSAKFVNFVMMFFFIV